MVISEQMLARMRAQVLARLPQTATILHKQETGDGMGGVEITLVPVAAVPARLDPPGSLERGFEFGGQPAIGIRRRLTLPHDAPLTAHNIVEVDGRRYEVLSLDDDHAWRVSVRAILSEIV